MTLWENGRAQPLPRHHGSIVRFLGYDPEARTDTLAGRLRAVRRRLGLTQAELAAKVGLDEGSVCRWESGSRQPSEWMSTRVATILDRLEKSTLAPAESSGAPAELPTLSYFDQTRWRRRPPPELMESGPASLGDLIRGRRLELGLSQAQLGARLGVGRAAIYRWERGEGPPPERYRSALGKFIGRRSTAGDG